jgi:hypothetical protein
LHATVHAWPTGDVGRERISLFGFDVTVCRMSSQRLARPIALPFEDVLERLSALARLFIEPDGSFVWVDPSSNSPAWQIDGQLHDSAAGLMTVELKLAGVRPDWTNVLRCLDWPAQPLIFQLVQQGAFLDEDSWKAVCTKVLRGRRDGVASG